jgi:hypothetical protein
MFAGEVVRLSLSERTGHIPQHHGQQQQESCRPLPFKIRLCTRIWKNVHSTRLSEMQLFPLRWPPKQHILARMADKPGTRCGNGAPRAESWDVCRNGSARPRSLETRKGRGFPHSHSDGDYDCHIGQNC